MQPAAMMARWASTGHGCAQDQLFHVEGLRNQGNEPLKNLDHFQGKGQ